MQSEGKHSRSRRIPTRFVSGHRFSSAAIGSVRNSPSGAGFFPAPEGGFSVVAVTARREEVVDKTNIMPSVTEAVSENRLPIAAVNRRATQNQPREARCTPLIY